MALFGAPLACEDHSHRAVLTALGIQQAINEQGLGNDFAHGQQVSIRIGLNTGPVVVGKIGNDLRMDYTAIGDTTNLAARLEALAEPGTIYLSEHTYRNIERQFKCEPIKAQLPKSGGEFVTVYQLQGVKSVEELESQSQRRNISSPLQGRDSELNTLTERFEQVSDKFGEIVFVLGEPGIGKSRLVAEAKRRISGKDLYMLDGRAFSHSQTVSYGMFVDIIKGDVGITAHDSDVDSLTKLERRIADLFPDESREIVPYLGLLLALNVGERFESQIKYMSGEDIQRQIFRTARRFFERLAASQPLLLFFEDMHWSDESSVKLLEHLLPLIESMPFLICWISRSEFSESSLKLRKTVDERYSSRCVEIELKPLSKSDSRNVVYSLLETHRLSRRVEEVIVDKAGGNPFFLEEVVRSLIDAVGLEEICGTNEWLAADRIEKIDIPESIDGVIMARVDRLPEETKHVLRLASVIGRSFFFPILNTLVSPAEELEESLATLISRDFIREKTHVPELEYFFKHALVQEAIYDSILSNHRRDLHREVAQCIESLYVDRQEEFYSLLAYHYARAEEEIRALEYLIKAGDQAGELAADAEALKHYLQAMETYSRLFGERSDPVQCASLERKIGEALYRRGDHGNAQECFYRALIHLKSPYPTSSQAVARAILNQILVQAAHRIRQPALQAHQTKTEHKNS